MKYSVITVLGLNPEPWEPSRAAAVRRKGGGFGVVHHKPKKLALFQEALTDAVQRNPECSVWVPSEGEYLLVRFWLCRTLEASTRDTGRRHRSHQADATNMQKAIEDALQGVLFGNDRDNRHVSTTITEQAHDVDPWLVIERTLVNELPLPPEADSPSSTTIDLRDPWASHDISTPHDIPRDAF